MIIKCLLCETVTQRRPCGHCDELMPLLLTEQRLYSNVACPHACKGSRQLVLFKVLAKLHIFKSNIRCLAEQMSMSPAL